MSDVGMNCSEVRARFIGYIDEDLSDTDRLSVELHIAQCYSCREELDEMGRLLELCEAALRHPCPQDRFEELKERLASDEPQYSPIVPRRKAKPREVLFKLAVAAAIIAVLATSPLLIRGVMRLFEAREDSATLAGNGAGLGRLHLRFELPFVERRRKIEEEAENRRPPSVPVDRSDALRDR